MYTGLYRYPVSDLQKQSCRMSNVIGRHNVYFLCNQKRWFWQSENGRGQTKVLLIITLLLVVSTLLIAFVSSLDKIRSNKIVALFVII